MNISNTIQIISSPVFAKLAENWFGIPKDKIIRRFLFVDRLVYFNVGIILVLTILKVFSPEESFAGVVSIFLALSTIGQILLIFFSCIFFEKFESQFKKLLEYLYIDITNKEDLKHLNDFSFLETKAQNVIEIWMIQYKNEVEAEGIASVRAIREVSRFRRNYEFLRKFGLVKIDFNRYTARKAVFA